MTLGFERPILSCKGWPYQRTLSSTQKAESRLSAAPPAGTDAGLRSVMIRLPGPRAGSRLVGVPSFVWLLLWLDCWMCQCGARRYTLFSLALGCSVAVFEPVPMFHETMRLGLSLNPGFGGRTALCASRSAQLLTAHNDPQPVYAYGCT